MCLQNTSADVHQFELACGIIVIHSSSSNGTSGTSRGSDVGSIVTASTDRQKHVPESFLRQAFTTFKLYEDKLQYLKDPAMNEKMVLSLVQGTEQRESLCEHHFEKACHVESASEHDFESSVIAHSLEQIARESAAPVLVYCARLQNLTYLRREITV